MAPLLNQGYCVIIDNWFSSPDLFHELCSKQTDVIGTLHQNRKGVPAEIKSAKLQNGERVSVYTDRLMIMKWKDKKNIFLISTTHDNKMVPSRVRGQGMEKPELIIIPGWEVCTSVTSYRSTRKTLKKITTKNTSLDLEKEVQFSLDNFAS
jgi:hypothetical protein